MYSKLFFDKSDRHLLQKVNEAMSSDHASDWQTPNINLHPHGIVELAVSHEFRVAFAVSNLLSKLEEGQAEDRLIALRALYDEVLHSAKTSFRYNTGRVLLEIMKDFIRAKEDEERQLRLIHDFRKAASGNPRVIRHFLEQYHLLEMPEDQSQLTIDHHVHDANTKGRKNPTHLIMDAWIKGIRYLTVVYYNYVEIAVAKELLHAAKIMGITVRIGVEFSTVFYKKFVKFIWVPRGFADSSELLEFLEEPTTQALFTEGRKASIWNTSLIYTTLERWNAEHRVTLGQELDIELPMIALEVFKHHVRSGQASLLHLSELIHKTILPLLKEHATTLHTRLHNEHITEEQSAALKKQIHEMDMLTPDTILTRWLTPELNPELYCLEIPCTEENTPILLQQSPQSLFDWLASLRSGFRLSLQVINLSVEDVLELLWDGQGYISHLEIFNLREWQQGHMRNIEAISALQQSINERSVLYLNQIIRQMIQKMQTSENEEDQQRAIKFQLILQHVQELQGFYRGLSLQTGVGTDSTSNSNLRYGMGLAVFETLPPQAQKTIRKPKQFRPMYLPVQVELAQRQTWTEPVRLSRGAILLRSVLRHLPFFEKWGMNSVTDWSAMRVTVQKKRGNLISMGGFAGRSDNNLTRQHHDNTQLIKPKLSFGYLNTTVSNVLKVLGGFIPAMAAFQATQEWWVLAWFGAFIWFGITGGRNILQAIFAGGGLRASSLLRWTKMVNWTRISDSLFYTGLSVVLLEWFMRVNVLQEALGLTTANQPVLVFTLLALTNGLYIAWHNAFRGFPKAVIIGNFFRSVLAIPVSVLYFNVFFFLFHAIGVADPLLILQPGATILSKAASDTVAALLEGLVDRHNNYRLRLWDYKSKLVRMDKNYTALALCLPHVDILEELKKQPQRFFPQIFQHCSKAYHEMILNALDLMYFWMYQPCAQQTLMNLLRTMSPSEQEAFFASQQVLTRVRDISQLFVDGIVGEEFSRSLSFYLSQHENYLQALRKQLDKTNPPVS